MHYSEFATGGCIVSPPNMICVTALYLPVANFLQCISAKNCENWLALDKVIAKIIRLTFFARPV